MPIEGLSETRRLPRLGKIHLGIKQISQKGNEYPVAVDYFVPDPQCEALITEVCGEKPKELPILFATETWPEQWYKAYSKTRGLICKGNGRTAMALVDEETGEIASASAKETTMREVNCNPDTCGMFQRGQCRRIMNLQFIIPEVKTLGVFQLDTGSINSIININSMLDLVKGITGRISMIPMRLALTPQQVQVEGKTKTVHVLQLRMNRSFEELVQLPSLPRSQVLLPDVEAGGAPEDLYLDSAIGDDGEQHRAALPPPQQGPETRRRGRPKGSTNRPRDAETPQSSPVPKADATPVAGDTSEPATEAKAEQAFPPPAQDADELQPTKPEIARDTLLSLCSEVDAEFYRDVIGPLQTCSANNTDETMVNWLKGNATEPDVREAVAEMRAQGHDDQSVRDVAAKVLGRPAKLPFTMLEVYKLRRFVQRASKPVEDEDDILKDFE